MPDADDKRWNEAIDWLLNSRHTADPDIQGPFWAYIDGLITRSELDHFSAKDVQEREAERASGVTGSSASGAAAPNPAPEMCGRCGCQVGRRDDDCPDPCPCHLKQVQA